MWQWPGALRPTSPWSKTIDCPERTGRSIRKDDGAPRDGRLAPRGNYRQAGPPRLAKDRGIDSLDADRLDVAGGQGDQGLQGGLRSPLVLQGRGKIDTTGRCSNMFAERRACSSSAQSHAARGHRGAMTRARMLRPRIRMVDGAWLSSSVLAVTVDGSAFNGRSPCIDQRLGRQCALVWDVA